MRRSVAGTLAAVTAASGLYFTATPADAHAITLSKGGGTAEVSADHIFVYVTDTRCDGKAVHVYIHENGGTNPYFWQVDDYNNCNPGGTTHAFWDRIDSIQVCYDSAGCSSAISP